MYARHTRPRIILIAVSIIAGSGKSTLWFVFAPCYTGVKNLTSTFSSMIVECIESLCEAQSALMAYFYFDSKDLDKQRRRNLLPSLLIQLSTRSRSYCDILSRLYSAHHNGRQRPSDGDMMQCLKDMLALPQTQPIYIILDALDECPNWPGIPSPREQVLALVKELVDLHLPYLHICVTSRPELDIRGTLTPLAHHRVSLHDESGHKKDIFEYVKSIVYSDSETVMKRWRDDDKKMVFEVLSEKADGMWASSYLHHSCSLTPSYRFPWVFCQLDALRRCLPSSLRRTLEELPESLDETYERIVKNIKKGNRADAYRMLQCLAVANRPLSVPELAELIAFDFDACATNSGIPKLNSKWRWEDHEQAVLSTCSSLIAIVPTDDSAVVQFSHFSVKEFLLSDGLSTSEKDISRYYIALDDANTLIAKACLGVLLQDPVDESGAATPPSPLAQYAAEHWVVHAKVKNVATHLRHGIESLFDSDRPYFSAWIKLNDAGNAEWPTELENKIRPEAAPLYHAAHHGFHEIVERLSLKHPEYVNAISGLGGTALHSASEAGHVEVVRSLLQCGAEVDVLSVSNMSSLQFASLHGHLGVVQCLLDHGADVNYQDDLHRTPLTLATGEGYLEIVRILLENNADINFQDKDGMTSLHRMFLLPSLSEGDRRPQVVRYLLERGMNPNARDNEGRTPLHVASSPSKFLFARMLSSRLEIAPILSAHGADIDAEDNEGRTPLQVALAGGQTEMAQLLSECCSK